MSSKEDGRKLPGEINGDDPLSVVPLDAEERLETERVLGAFAPRAPRLHRERLLALVKDVRQPATFASPAVQLRTPWYWPAATAVMTATSLALAVLLSVRVPAAPTVRVEYRDKVVYREPKVEMAANADAKLPTTKQYVGVQPPRGPQDSAAKLPLGAVSRGMGITAHPEDNYLRDRRVALAQGVDAVALFRPVASTGRIAPPATQQELLRQFVPLAALRPAATSSNWLGWPAGQ